MIAVWKREWRAFFRSFRGFAILGLFAFFVGLFVTVHHFIYGATTYEEVLSLLSVGVALLIPLFTVPLFFTDCDGEEELFALLSLTKKERYLGKYLFALSVLGLMTGILALCAQILFYIAHVNLLSAWAALLGFALLEHTVLLACFLTALTFSKRWVAYAVSYGALAVMVVLQAVAGYLTGGVKRVVETLSVFGAFSSLGEGRAEARTLILYLSLSLLLLVLFFRKIREPAHHIRKMELRLAVFTLVGAVLLNGAALLIPAGALRLDLTDEKIYSLSDSSRDFLADLDRDVTLTVINSDRSDRKLEAFLESMDAASPRLSVRYAKAPEETELLTRAGLTADSVPAYTLVAESEMRVACLGYTDLFYYVNGNADIVSFVNYYRALYGMSGSSGNTVQMPADEYASYYTLLGQSESYVDYFEALVYESYLYFQGEALTSLIEYVAADLIPREYILTGHGETAQEGSLMGDMLDSFGEQAYLPLDFNTVDAIPEDAASVLMLKPTKDYTEGQIAALREYLERGGTLTVVTGQNNLSETPALMGLLASYGLSTTAETVWVEIEETTEQTDAETGEPIVEKTRSDTVEVKINTDHKVFSVLAGDGTLAPAIKGGNAIVINQTEDPSLIHTPLLTSTASARLGEGTETVGEYTLAAAAENGAGAKLLWFTGGDSFTVSIETYADENIYDVYLLMMGAKWTDLVYRSEVALPEAKLYEPIYVLVGEKTALAVGVVTIFLIPLCLISVGGILHFKRRKA